MKDNKRYLCLNECNFHSMVKKITGTGFVRQVKGFGVRVPKPYDVKGYPRVARNEVNRMISAIRRAGYGSRVIPGVLKLADKKALIVEKVERGTIPQEELNDPRLRALFSKPALESLRQHNKMKSLGVKERNAKIRNAKTILARAKRGNLSVKDLGIMEATFGKNGASKIIIAYNDLLVREGSKRKRLPETKETTKLREKINSFKEEQRKFRNALNIFKSMETQKLGSEQEFIHKLLEVSPEVLNWFKGIDWRDKPFIIQFATWGRAKIPNPFSNKIKYCEGYGIESCKRQYNQAIEGLEKTISKYRTQIKIATIQEAELL